MPSNSRITWTIAHDHHVVVATLSADVGRADMEECLAAIDAAGAGVYLRILDLSFAVVTLGAADLRALAGVTADKRQLALVVAPALAVDLAAGFQRLAQTGTAPVQIFAATAEAREWLSLLGRWPPRN